MLPLHSPVSCIVFLALLAAASLFFAMRLPGPRDSIVPSPHRDADKLVMISAAGRYATQIPTIPGAAYQALSNRKDLFAATAFYRPIRARVSDTARANGGIVRRLGGPESLADPASDSPTGGARAAPAPAAWPKYFDGDPRIVGRVLGVAGRNVAVAGVIPGDGSWLPGRVDAWLIEDEQPLAVLTSQAPGFVVAQRKTPRPWWNSHGASRCRMDREGTATMHAYRYQSARFFTLTS